MTETTSRRRRLSAPAPATRRLLLGLVVAEAALVSTYLLLFEARVLSVRYLLYPFLWVNLGVLAVFTTDVPRVRDRRTAAAAALAAGYYLLLAWTTGLVGPGTGGSLSVQLVPVMPGWGPVLLVGGPVSLALIPFETLGYAAVALLVYAGVARAAAGVLSGVLGVVTCVSCVGPVVAGVASGLLGGTSSALVAATSGPWAYDLSTAVFVVTVCALWWSLH
jgi:hypothetical protein